MVFLIVIYTHAFALTILYATVVWSDASDIVLLFSDIGQVN